MTIYLYIYIHYVGSVSVVDDDIYIYIYIYIYIHYVGSGSVVDDDIFIYPSFILLNGLDETI